MAALGFLDRIDGEGLDGFRDEGFDGFRGELGGFLAHSGVNLSRRLADVEWRYGKIAENPHPIFTQKGGKRSSEIAVAMSIWAGGGTNGEGACRDMSILTYLPK